MLFPVVIVASIKGVLAICHPLPCRAPCVLSHLIHLQCPYLVAQVKKMRLIEVKWPAQISKLMWVDSGLKLRPSWCQNPFYYPLSILPLSVKLWVNEWLNKWIWEDDTRSLLAKNSFLPEGLVSPGIQFNLDFAFHIWVEAKKSRAMTLLWIWGWGVVECRVSILASLTSQGFGLYVPHLCSDTAWPLFF